MTLRIGQHETWTTPHATDSTNDGDGSLDLFCQGEGREFESRHPLDKGPGQHVAGQDFRVCATLPNWSTFPCVDFLSEEVMACVDGD